MILAFKCGQIYQLWLVKNITHKVLALKSYVLGAEAKLGIF